MSEIRRTLQRVVLKNGDQHAITLCVEPWANEYSMPVGTEWTLEIEGPAYPDANIMVERESDRLVAFGWDGSDFRILDGNGKVLEDWLGIRVPDFRDIEKERHRRA